jgi:hypothetical protein
MESQTIDIEQLRERKIMVATPMFAGQCSGQYTKSCTDLAKMAAQYGLDLEFFFLFNESLITRARNYCVDEFLRNEKYTHLMFIDADIGFDPRNVIDLAWMTAPGTDKDIVCAPYPKKTISWEKIKLAVDKGFADENPQNLKNYVGDYVFNPTGETRSIKLDEPVEVLEGGTGFMCIRRDVFERFAEAYPELKYKPDHVRTKHFDGSRHIHAYFETVIDPETERYLSEDYMFCQYARKAGMKVWLCPWMHLVHMGSYFFGGSLPHLAQIGASATADPNEKLK